MIFIHIDLKGKKYLRNGSIKLFKRGLDQLLQRKPDIPGERVFSSFVWLYIFRSMVPTEYQLFAAEYQLCAT